MSKRGQNEGTITKRADGRWEAKINLGYKNGKRHRRSFYGKTRREVAEKLASALREHQQGLPVAAERQTVAQFLDRWLADVVQPAVRPKTHHSYAQLVRLHVKPALGHHQLTKLEPKHVQAMLNAKLASGLSPRTVQYIRAVLRRALGQAFKWGLVARNVAVLVDPPRSIHHETQFLPPFQARVLLEVVRGDRLEALYSVALALGLRQGEALGLRWRDVDLERGTLSVRTALQRVNSKLQLVEPKTERSRRTLPLPPTVLAALRQHRHRQLQERLVAGSRWNNSWDLVFTSTIGTPLDARNVVRHFKGALERADLPDMRWHDLRHSCGSILAAKKVPLRVIQEILGHSQISTTVRYAHVVPEAQREAADLMEAVLAGEA